MLQDPDRLIHILPRFGFLPPLGRHPTQTQQRLAQCVVARAQRNRHPACLTVVFFRDIHVSDILCYAAKVKEMGALYVALSLDPGKGEAFSKELACGRIVCPCSFATKPKLRERHPECTRSPVLLQISRAI